MRGRRNRSASRTDCGTTSLNARFGATLLRLHDLPLLLCRSVLSRRRTQRYSSILTNRMGFSVVLRSFRCVLTLQLLQLERMLAPQFSEHLSLLLQRLIIVVVDVVIVALVSDAPSPPPMKCCTLRHGRREVRREVRRRRR
jgi:hypothetical protein